MDQDDAFLPEQIGPYRVTGRLGRGGMGEVLRGHDDRLHRPVALKRVHSDVRQPEQALRRFRREAQAVARLNHPAIVQVYDWEEDAGHHWLVMELVDGRPLDELIDEGPLPPKRALKLAHDIASGLAEAHEAGLVHRDLKAANVMVTAKGSCKILDFGLAKTVRLEATASKDSETARTLMSTLTAEAGIVGTVTAMSPEQAQGKKVDHRSDLFSLGILLYQMLSGVLPFRGDSAIETLTRICTFQEKPLLSLDLEIPEGLANFVGRLLEKEPARRPQSALQVMAEIDRLKSGDQEAAAKADPEAEQETRVSLVATESWSLRESPTGGEALEDLEAEAQEIASKRHRGFWRPLGLVAVGVLVIVGVWTSWVETTKQDGSSLGMSPPTAASSSVELGAHDFFRRGMKALDRYDQKGNIGKAIDDFQRALALDENYAPALAGLAYAYRRDYLSGGRDQQRLQQALAAAEQAVQVNEHLAFSHVSLGMVYSELGRYEDAIRELERALQIEPLNGKAWAGLGHVGKAQGDSTRAEECYTKAIEVEPDHWIWYSHLGVLYYHTDRYDEAASAFERQLKLAPDNLKGLTNLGAVYYMRSRLGDAATQFQRALQIQEDSKTYSNLGTIYFAQGLYSQAVSAFEKAVEGGGAQRYQKWANLGDGYRWTPDNETQARAAYRRAIQLLREKLEKTPNDSNLLTLVPLYEAKSGDCVQALAGVVKLDPLPTTEATAWFQVAVTNEVCGRRDEALRALENALSAGYPVEDVHRDPELLELRQDVRYGRLRPSLEGQF